MNDEVKKLSMVIPISNEITLRAEPELAFALSRLWGPDTRTPEQKAADEKRWQEMDAERKRADQAELNAHGERMAAATGLRRAILELHAPQRYESGRLHCDGCDMDGYEVEAPDFPCRTYTLAAEASE